MLGYMSSTVYSSLQRPTGGLIHSTGVMPQRMEGMKDDSGTPGADLQRFLTLILC